MLLQKGQGHPTATARHIGRVWHEWHASRPGRAFRSGQASPRHAGPGAVQHNAASHEAKGAQQWITIAAQRTQQWTLCLPTPHKRSPLPSTIPLATPKFLALASAGNCISPSLLCLCPPPQQLSLTTAAPHPGRSLSLVKTANIVQSCPAFRWWSSPDSAPATSNGQWMAAQLSGLGE